MVIVVIFVELGGVLNVGWGWDDEFMFFFLLSVVMVGCVVEFVELCWVFVEVCDGVLVVVFVEGEVGIGKLWLLCEFVVEIG